MKGSKKSFTVRFKMTLKTFMKPLKESRQLKHLSASQQQAIIKLIEKPKKDKRYTTD